MVDDKYKLILIISLVATISVFLSGVVLGWTIDNFRENGISESMTQSELDLESFMIEQQLISSFDGGTCPVLGARIADLQKQASEIGRTIEDYEQSGSNAVDYDYLKRKHIILNTRLWLLMDNLNRNCEGKQTSLIYFYEQNCRACLMQGYVLDDLNKELNNSISIFAYDADFTQEPLIKLLKNNYNITTAPTIIYKENKKEGFVTKEELQYMLISSTVENL